MKTISKLFLLLSIILLSSCDETELDQTVTNQVNPQKEEDSRIVFNSAKEFYNTLDTLSYMTYEEQTEWIRASGIKYPLYKDLEFCEDEIMTEMPRAFQALFNHKMEMQINDTVIAFEKGNMYVKSIKEKILPVPVLYGQVGVNQEESEVTTRTVYETKYGKMEHHINMNSRFQKVNPNTNMYMNLNPLLLKRTSHHINHGVIYF